MRHQGRRVSGGTRRADFEAHGLGVLQVDHDPKHFLGCWIFGPECPQLKRMPTAIVACKKRGGTVNLLEVAPAAAHLPVIVTAGKSWLATHPDSKTLWFDLGTGRGPCSLMEASDPKPFGLDRPLRKEIDILLGSLIRAGVAEAHRLEESLRLI